MEYAAGAVPWLCALLHLQAQQLEAFGVGFLPVLAGAFVLIDVFAQGGRQRCQGTGVDVFGQVGIKVFGRRLFLLDVDLQAIEPNVYGFWVDDFNFDWRFGCAQLVDACRLLVQRFVNIGCHVSVLS